MRRPEVKELAALFPTNDFEFGMSLGKGDLPAFFSPASQRPELIAERAHWLSETPEVYLGYEPGADDVTAEFVENGIANGFLPANLANLLPRDAFRWIAVNLDAETMLLKADAFGSHKLVAGAVCFPSSWSLAEKMGHPLAAIHDPVPTVNSRFGARIDTFLSRMKPGTAWERSNWGLSRSPDLNQHPNRKLPRLDATVGMHEVFLRLEQQILAPLPRTGGTVFGLQLFVYPLRELAEVAEIRNGLAHALKTMPPEIAAYKGIANARERIITLLEQLR